ncbi:MAG: hypothetical protein ACFFCW_05045 [Candidatus Hodarchaeota archaeon]
MNIFQIYSDSTKCNKNTFQIFVTIWGFPKNCLSYKNDIQGIVNKNAKILGRDFKGFHAYNINEKNWKTIGQVYLEVLNKLIEYMFSGSLNMLIILEAEEKYKNNAGFLKNLIRFQLENRESVIGKQFKSLKNEDLPAVYHRIDQLIIYLKYRDRFGDNGDKFEFYPDSEGKILNYSEKKFRVSGNLPIEYPLEFYRLIAILGNALSRVIKLEGWPVKKHRLIKFQPLKWTEDYLIQSCDIISNYFYNFLRYQVGISEKKYELKSGALMSHIGLDKHISKIKKSFENDSGEVICTDNQLKVSIDMSVGN